MSEMKGKTMDEHDRIVPSGFGSYVEAPPIKVVLMSSEPMWDIIKTVAKEDSLYETAMGGVECIYCSGTNYSSENFKHDDTCIVVKARALMVLRESEGS
jgi:hypothetical protein